MTYPTYTLTERFDDDLEAVDWAIIKQGWKNFMLQDNIADLYFDELYVQMKDFQFYVFDEDDTTLIAVGNSIPVMWDGTLEGLPANGWDGALEGGFKLKEAEGVPDTLCALGITIAPGYLGKKISRVALKYMKSLAAKHGFKSLIAPVRPNLKERYPLTPMERYITWTQEDGAPFDPWIRTHWRVGAKILRVCNPSMIIQHPVADWEEWTGLRFPESGEYVIDGALNPITIDLEKDEGCYIEPNVWMLHEING